MKTNTARAEKLLLCTFLQIKEELGHGETSSRIWMLQRAKSLRICSFPDVYIYMTMMLMQMQMQHDL